MQRNISERIGEAELCEPAPAALELSEEREALISEEFGAEFEKTREGIYRADERARVSRETNKKTTFSAAVEENPALRNE